MVNIFDTVTLRYKGRSVTIPPNAVLRAVAAAEEHVTLYELMKYKEKETAPLARLAMAYAAMLRVAGLSVNDDEVYADMFIDQGAPENVSTAVYALLVLMVPPSALHNAAGVRKKTNEGNASGGGASSSPTYTEPSSRKRSGSRRRNSGSSTQSNSGG